MYAVIACPRCRRARVIEEGRRTTSCASCDRTLVIADLRAYGRDLAFEEAQNAAGLLNAKLAGREAEFAAAFIPPPPAPARHDTPHAAAAAAARKGAGEAQRFDLLARELSVRLRSFTEEDLQEAAELAGLRAGKVGAHLVRMLSAQVVYEPRAGCYAAL